MPADALLQPCSPRCGRSSSDIRLLDAHTGVIFVAAALARLPVAAPP